MQETSDLKSRQVNGVSADQCKVANSEKVYQEGEEECDKPSVSGYQKFWDATFTVIWRTIFHVVAATGLWGFFWRPVYKLLVYMHKNGTAEMRFMNYGFVPVTDEDRKALSHTKSVLKKEPQHEHTHIRLYERILSLLPDFPEALSGCDLLEISCGHGGGIQWILKAHPNIKSIKGSVYNGTKNILDETDSQIGGLPNITFSFGKLSLSAYIGIDLAIVDDMDGRIIQGNALKIPLPNESVDIILNVESSHCYDDQPGFLKQCFKLLRPGGIFIWADVRPVDMYGGLWLSDPVDAGFEPASEPITINEQVLRSLDLQNERILAPFQAAWYTRYFDLFWNAFWGKPGTGMYRNLQRRKFLYRAMAWQKPKN